jgi:hypothetical protein
MSHFLVKLLQKVTVRVVRRTSTYRTAAEADLKLERCTSKPQKRDASTDFGAHSNACQATTCV